MDPWNADKTPVMKLKKVVAIASDKRCDKDKDSGYLRVI